MDELYNEVCDIIQEQYDNGDLTEEDATALMEAAYDRYVVEGTNKRRMDAYRRLKENNKKYRDDPDLYSDKVYIGKLKYKLGRSARSKKEYGKMAAGEIDFNKFAKENDIDHEDISQLFKDLGRDSKKDYGFAISRLTPSKEEARKNKKEFLKTLPRLPKGNTKSKQYAASSKPTNKRVLHIGDDSTVRKMNNTLPYKKNGEKSFTFNKPFGKMKSSKKINIKNK